MHDLVHENLISSSGTPHPYYSVRKSASAEPAEAMFVKFTSYPSLGRDHVVPKDDQEVHFSVFTETATMDLEVQLWHNASSEWEALPLTRSTSLGFRRSHHDSCSFPQTRFAASIARPTSPKPVSFTLRCRRRGEASWKWANDAGHADGQLLFQSTFQKQALDHYFSHMATDLQIHEEHSETPDTQLWSLTLPVNEAHAEKSGWTTSTLGMPKALVRWFAHVRLWSPWLAPRHGKSGKLAEKDAILYSFLRKDGLHVVALAISGVEDIMTVFQDGGDGYVKISARNDRETRGTARIVVAVGQSFETANAAAIYHARHVVSTLQSTDAELDKITQNWKPRSEDEVKANWVQDWYDGFSFCTWNSLGQSLTGAKIMTALDSLHSNGINVTNLIIDDNWQSLDKPGESQFVRGWAEFEANKEGFPEGIAHVAKDIRQKYTNIRHIAVWHAILGYWGGIAPDGRIAKEYKTRQVKHDPRGPMRSSFLVVDEPDVRRMYNDFYNFLITNGIDGVKTDAQFVLDEIDNADARRDLTRAYQDAWAIAQLRHFSGTAISCMSQTPPILYHSQLPATTPAIPVRNSDDFFPDVEASHPWHIFCNAHNALFTKYLNVLPDWDMFQTHHHWSGFHAAARAVSGGPIYITDEPGKHDIKLIGQLTARAPRSKQTVVLRPSVVGRSVNVYTSYEEQQLCKVAAYHGHAETGAGFLGLFNVQSDSITETIPFSDFIGCDNKQDYLVRHFRSGVSNVLGKDGIDVVTLKGHDWNILTAVPIRKVKQSGRTVEIANHGLVEKMTGAAAIVNDQIKSMQDGRLRIDCNLKALGVWGVSINKPVELEKDLFALIEGKQMPIECVHVQKEGEGVLLTLDLEQAWDKLNLDVGYSNEVRASIFV